MDVAVVLIRDCRCISIPIVLVFVDVLPEHGKDSSIVTFDLAVGLRMIR